MACEYILFGSYNILNSWTNGLNGKIYINIPDFQLLKKTQKPYF